MTGHDWCCSGLLSSYSASGLVPVPGFRDLVLSGIMFNTRYILSKTTYDDGHCGLKR